MNSQEPALGRDSTAFEPSTIDPPALDTSVIEAAVVDAAIVEAENSVIPPSPVNYDDEGLTEVCLGETEYRFDAGKQGTALCLSERPAGTYAWRFLGEVRWDGRDLRSRELARSLLGELSLALRKYVAETAS